VAGVPVTDESDAGDHWRAWEKENPDNWARLPIYSSVLVGPMSDEDL